MAIRSLNKKVLRNPAISSTLVKKPWCLCKKTLGFDPYWAQQRSLLGAISDPYAKNSDLTLIGHVKKTFWPYLVLMQKNLWDLRIWPDLPLTLVKKTLVLMQKNFDGNVHF